MIPLWLVPVVAGYFAAVGFTGKVLSTNRMPGDIVVLGGFFWWVTIPIVAGQELAKWYLAKPVVHTQAVPVTKPGTRVARRGICWECGYHASHCECDQ